MATSLEKILDIISKAAAVQQMSNIHQPQNTQDTSTIEASPSGGEPNKYIYIGMEELKAIFPGLGDKLDIPKILSSLSDKLTLNKILASLGAINIKPVENNTQNQNESKEENPQL